MKKLKELFNKLKKSDILIDALCGIAIVVGVLTAVFIVLMLIDD